MSFSNAVRVTLYNPLWHLEKPPKSLNNLVFFCYLGDPPPPPLLSGWLSSLFDHHRQRQSFLFTCPWSSFIFFFYNEFVVIVTLFRFSGYWFCTPERWLSLNLLSIIHSKSRSCQNHHFSFISLLSYHSDM